MKILVVDGAELFYASAKDLLSRHEVWAVSNFVGARLALEVRVLDAVFTMLTIPLNTMPVDANDEGSYGLAVASFAIAAGIRQVVVASTSDPFTALCDLGVSGKKCDQEIREIIRRSGARSTHSKALLSWDTPTVTRFKEPTTYQMVDWRVFL